MIVLTGIFLAALIFHRILKISVLRCLPVAFCVVVAAASILVTTLSLFNALEPNLIRFIIALSYGALGALAWRSGAVSIRSWRASITKWSWQDKILLALILSVLSVVCLLATLYPPMNWDSMTYHLSRVAIWIKNRSVFPYVTNNFRQVQLTPGAEYLILVEQMFWFSDVFANWIQFSAFITIGCGFYGWCRYWGIPRTSTFLLIVTTLSAPMVLMQAQTTQNDLVAAVPVMALSMLVVDRFIAFGRSAFTAPLTQVEAITLPLAVATGHLIKPTATLISAPLLLIFIVPTICSIMRDRKWLSLFIGANFFGAAASLPEIIIRRLTFGTVSISDQHVRTAFSEPGEQLFNGLRHLSDHLPSGIVVPLIEYAAPLFRTLPNIMVNMNQIFSANEDLTGNPVQAIFYLLIFIILVSCRSKAGLFLCLVSAAAWFLLHAVVNNQPWMSRLQTPWFVLMISCAAFAVYLYPRALRPILWGSSLVSFYLTCILLSSAIEDRMLYFGDALPLDNQARYHGYFLRRPPAELPFKKLKRKISSCQTIQYISGEDDFDYPVAWLTIRNNRRFEHVAAQQDQLGGCTIRAGDR